MEDKKFFVEVKIPAPQEVVNQIEVYNLDYMAKQTLLTFILENPDLDISQEQIDNYKKEYTEAYALFELGKKEFASEYIEPVIKSSVDYVWTLDYDSLTATVTFQG